jgi:hypothetical protein
MGENHLMAYGWHFDKLIGMALIAYSWHVMGSTFVLPVSYLKMPGGGLVGKRITSGTTCTPPEPGPSLSLRLSVPLPLYLSTALPNTAILTARPLKRYALS